MANRINAHLAELGSLTRCGRQLAGMKLTEENKTTRSGVFQLTVTQILCNVMGNLYGGAMGVIFEEACESILSLYIKKECVGETLSLGIYYYRATPMGSEVSAVCSLIDLSQQLAIFSCQLLSSEGKILGKGTILKRIEDKKGKIQMQNLPPSSPEDISFPPLSDICSQVYPFIKGNVTPKYKENLHQAICWVIHSTNASSHIDPPEFSSTIVSSTKITKIDVDRKELDTELIMDAKLANQRGGIHPGALHTIIDEITAMLKICIQMDGTQFVSVFIELKQLVHYLPLGEVIQVKAKCGKAGKRFYFLECEFYHKETLLAIGSHVLTPAGIISSNL